MKFAQALLILAIYGGPAVSAQPSESYLSLSADQARKIALSTRVSGRVGKSLDFRILATDRSFNYKLRATWMTPDVIGANARLLQLSLRLSDAQTRKLVAEAEAIRDTVVLVELDPREGSGVIPRDWVPVLQARQGAAQNVTGRDTPELRDIKALAGAARRDYNYDVFWVVFPLKNNDGKLVFGPEAQEAELVVRIYDKEGIVRWPIPEAIRRLTQ